MSYVPSGKLNLLRRGRNLALTFFLMSTLAVQAQVYPSRVSATPKVTGVSGNIRIGQTIIIDVENLSQWSVNHDAWKLVPYLNGHPLAGVYPKVVDLSRNSLQFHLSRTEESSATWSTLFLHPVFHRPVTLSVGLVGQAPFETVFDRDHAVALVVVPQRRGLVALIVALAVFSVTTYLMFRTSFIRERGPHLPLRKRRYDLGLFLTTFWLVIVATSYFCIWLITDDSHLPPTALALTGFSSIAAVVSYLKQARPLDAWTDSGAVHTGDKQSRPVNFFANILSNNNGYSLPRFQLFMCNVLLGIIFVSFVFDNLALPHFSHSLLALAGLSTSIFLGFEIVGRKRLGRPAWLSRADRTGRVVQ